MNSFERSLVIPRGDVSRGGAVTRRKRVYASVPQPTHSGYYNRARLAPTAASSKSFASFSAPDSRASSRSQTAMSSFTLATMRDCSARGGRAVHLSRISSRQPPGIAIPRARSYKPRSRSSSPRSRGPEPRSRSPEPRDRSPEPRSRSPGLRCRSSELRVRSSEPRHRSKKIRRRSSGLRRRCSEVEGGTSEVPPRIRQAFFFCGPPGKRDDRSS